MARPKSAAKTFGFLPKLPNDDSAAAPTSAEILPFPTPGQAESCGEKPNVSRSRRKYLTPDEARRVIDAAGKIGRQRERDQLLLTMMFRHGLRVSEAVELQRTDFGLDAPRDRPFWVRWVKDGALRTHTLEPDTVRRLARAKKASDGIYVFRSERGGKMSTDIVALICERAGYAAGLDFKVRPHMFRHAAGFSLAEAGTDTRLIQDFLGHKDIKSTVAYTATSQRRLAAVRVR